MNFKILVYTSGVFKEIFLPPITDGEYSVLFKKEDFGLSVDLEMNFEVTDGIWKYRRSKNCQIIKDERICVGEPLLDNDVVTIVYSANIQMTVIVNEIERSIETFLKFDISNFRKVSIGKSKDNDIIFEYQNLISRKHAVLYSENGGIYVQDYSTNGIYINSKRIQGIHRLEFGDNIHIFGLRIVYLGKILAISSGDKELFVDQTVLRPFFGGIQNISTTTTHPLKHEFFHRSPRNMPKIETGTIEIEAPPAPQPVDRPPLLMTIGPSLTMAFPMMLGCGMAIIATQQNGGTTSPFMYTGIITAVSAAIVGVIWALVNLNYAKKKEKEKESHRFDSYKDYLVETANEVRSMYENNTRVLHELYPSVDDSCNISNNMSNLWTRNFTHKDILYHRLGLGSLPFQVDVAVPKKKFTLIDDELAEKPAMIANDYKTLNNVPVGIDLFDYHIIGIIGGRKKKGAENVVRTLALQIASNNCYTDIKMGFVYNTENDKDAEEAWAFAKWLPHVWSKDKNTRFVAENKKEASDVFFELTNIMRIRSENSDTVSTTVKVRKKPHYVLFISNPEYLDGELISKYIYSNDDACGLTTILLAEKYEDLPNLCECIIQNDENYSGMYDVNDDTQNKHDISFDYISPQKAEVFARYISGIEVKETETGGDIPSSLTFFDMYGVNSLDEFHVHERWRRNRTYDSMKALIGQKAGGVDCFLDIHEKYHGPHGLIAGTTGSGKSETLQTYMLSLALNFSPKDVGFFVIDFKGGGMANLFSNLPHMIGQISNLSGNQVRRAMVSIKSENMRRQRIFSEHGVNNINLYTRLIKSNEATIPVPHLFIIIDEFAELKREEPEFMRELISVAQVGRSLGVHLILATQKPSGTVDDNIWSNSKFRLCLRVQDRQDSNDMLHKPDAAYITQAGRCYLQVGNDEIYEYFQSGYSGATYDPDMMSSKTEIASMLDNTGKSTIVGNRTKIKRKESQRIKWISFLIKTISETSEAMEVSLTEVVSDIGVEEKFINKIYDVIEISEFGYERSKYNTGRLEEFLTLRTLSGEKSFEQQAKEIIAFASASGIKLPETKEITQLDAVVEYLRDIADKSDFSYNFKLWLPVLPETMYLKDLQGYNQHVFDGKSWTAVSEKEWNLDVPVGLYDDPVNQSQKPLVIDPVQNGHYAICGTVTSGKSTFLQSFLYAVINKYDPRYVNIYGLDFSSHMLEGFESAPHVGDIMYENDLDKIAKFFNMIMKILNERKTLFKGGNYGQYMRANGIKVPSIIIAIDNFANFKEKTGNVYEDLLVRLASDGAGFGIFLVITAGGFGITEIQSRIGDKLKTVICLEMVDKFKYADALRTIHFDVLPETGIKGRGLANVGGTILEFQTALAFPAEDDYKRMDEIRGICEQMASVWTGACARRVPVIPEKPVWSDLTSMEEFDVKLADDRSVPYAYKQQDASVYALDLSRIYHYIISGKTGTGKTNTLKNIASSLKLKGADVCIIDTDSSELSRFASGIDAEYVNDEDKLFDYLTGIIAPFKERNRNKRTWLEEGIEDEEIYKRMHKEKCIVIMINDLVKFISKMYTPGGRGKDMVGFLENITEKGRLHNVYFIGCLNNDNESSVMGLKLYNNFTAPKTGVHLGGSAASQKIFDFSQLPFAEVNKAYKRGIALIPPNSAEPSITRIVVPLSGGKK